MTQILIDYPAEWPTEGALKIDAHFASEIPISPNFARRKGHGYITGYVVFFADLKNPILVAGEPPIWQFDVWLRMRGHGDVTPIGVMTVNALTGEPIPLSDEAKATMEKRAEDAATRLPSVPATIG